MKCEYCEITGGYGELILETPCWMIFLAPSQRYLGTCVVALKRHSPSLSTLKEKEWIDFGLTVHKLEKSVDKAFNPTLYNWSCFKNSAFRTDRPDPEVHWHFIPRYEADVEFEGLTFHDPDFGYVPQPIHTRVPPEIMAKMKMAIKKYYK